MTVVFYLFYRSMTKGTKQPLLIYGQILNSRQNHLHNKKVKSKMDDFRIISKEEKNPVFGSVVVIIIFVLIVFLLLFDVVYLVAVTSNSMKPTFERGDLVLMQSINKEPHVGDIVLFTQKRYLVPITHRVTFISEDGVRTKGDAANPDPFVVPVENIESKAIQVAGKPIVIRDIGEYFILETERQHYGKYGQEYSFIKNVFKTIRLYGYALCILAVLGFIYLTFKESKS